MNSCLRIGVLGDLLHLRGVTETARAASLGRKFRFVSFFPTALAALNGVLEVGCDAVLVVSRPPDLSVRELVDRLHSDKGIAIMGVQGEERFRELFRGSAHRVDIWLSQSVCQAAVEAWLVSLSTGNSHQTIGDRATALRAALTGRERQVAALVSLGFSDKEVAMRLGISVSTVKVHMHHILGKTGLSKRHELRTIDRTI